MLTDTYAHSYTFVWGTGRALGLLTASPRGGKWSVIFRQSTTGTQNNKMAMTSTVDAGYNYSFILFILNIVHKVPYTRA